MDKELIKKQFRYTKCSECPFKTECENMMDFTRQFTTSTFSLCSIIEGNVKIDCEE